MGNADTDWERDNNLVNTVRLSAKREMRLQRRTGRSIAEETHE